MQTGELILRLPSAGLLFTIVVVVVVVAMQKQEKKAAECHYKLMVTRGYLQDQPPLLHTGLYYIDGSEVGLSSAEVHSGRSSFNHTHRLWWLLLSPVVR